MTSAEQTASIKKSMQDEKCAKDQTIKVLVSALKTARAQVKTLGGRHSTDDIQIAVLKCCDAALRKAGAL